MKVIVTGASGFVGPYLIQELECSGHEVIPTSLREFDITQVQQWHELLKKQKPDAVVHLAALSSFDQCRADPYQTWQINTVCVEQLVREFMAQCPQGKFLYVSSGKIYAPCAQALKESSELMPADFYALTKLSADLRLAQLTRESSFCILTARPFNHTGPRQRTGFLCPDLIKRIAEHDQSQVDEVELEVGSLEAQVDLCDVRDIVRGYRLLLENQEQGGIFNFGSGKLIKIRDIVSILDEVVDVKLKPIEKKDHDRPYTSMIRYGDISKAKKTLHWRPEISLKQTLQDMWREREASCSR